MSAAGPPYLTLVLPSRNDDHGGDMLRRMQAAVDGILFHLERLRIDSELILVEWNPPADRPSVAAVVRWPVRTRYVSIRHIRVPTRIHERIPGHDRIPMHHPAALNTGIRRARGAFVLPATIDGLYSHELMETLARRALRRDALYRVDRWDVDRILLEYPTTEGRLAACEAHVLRVHLRRRHHYRDLPELHTNACGDFQLMAREAWHRIRGYREWDLPGAHCDSMVSYAAHAAGLEEIVLDGPCRLYHVEHDAGFGARLRRHLPRPVRFLEAIPLPLHVRNRVVGLLGRTLRLRVTSEVRGIPTLDWRSGGLDLCRDLVAGRRPYALNDEHWGLGDTVLWEGTIRSAFWDNEGETDRIAQPRGRARARAIRSIAG